MVEINSSDYRDFVIKDGKFIGEFEQMYRKIEDPWGQVRHAHSLKNDVLLSLIAHIHAGSPIRRALHAGCGLGALSARLRDTLGEVPEIWACDVSETAIQKASARHREIRFFVHDLIEVDRIPIAPGFFDQVLMAETAWYVLPSLTKVLRGFRGLLRCGGHLVIQQYFLQPGEQTYGTEIMNSPDDLVRLLVHAGFNVRHRMHLDPATNHSLVLWATAA